jgi:prephenate dehydratase
VSVSVAVQGVRGSYSEEAALRFFDRRVRILECRDFEETFSAVVSKRSQYAVVPLKNKIVGEIETAARLFLQATLRIRGELEIDVKHVLAGTPEARLEDLKTVRSHIEALKQCRGFFAAHQNLLQIAGADTASSIRRVIEDGIPENAAICSARAAQIYGAKVLREDIADCKDNWTRFYLFEN